jgi:uncharacterized cupin superfamily protein
MGGQSTNPPVLNVADVELMPRPAAFAATGPATAVFDARLGRVSSRLGARKLGYNVTAIPPGKAAFPCHCHHVNEEMFFVLDGAGEVRVGAETYPIRAGDVIACPPSGPERAHQIRNTGAVELRYLAVSTKLSPEIAEYPDSEKFGVLAELSASPGGEPRVFRFIGREGLGVDYWDGEGQGDA